MTIIIDFDDTVAVNDQFPLVGEEVPGAIDMLKELNAAKHQLILFTMRDKAKLALAVDWLMQKGVVLYGIQRNPTQDTWTSSPKAYAEIHIDDAGIGTPLIKYKGRMVVDWKAVRELLYAKEIITDRVKSSFTSKSSEILEAYNDDSIMTFGKYKDKPLEEVPDSYFQWLYEQYWFTSSNKKEHVLLQQYITDNDLV